MLRFLNAVRRTMNINPYNSALYIQITGMLQTGALPQGFKKALICVTAVTVMVFAKTPYYKQYFLFYGIE